MKNWLDLLQSKKFIATCLGVVTIIAGEGVTADSMTKVSAMIISFVFAQGIADHGKAVEQMRQQNNQ